MYVSLFDYLIDWVSNTLNMNIRNRGLAFGVNNFINHFFCLDWESSFTIITITRWNINTLLIAYKLVKECLKDKESYIN